MTRIAVLMTCYNRVQTTLECLRRLFDQDVPAGYAFDVWLVDDASPDKTGDKVLEWYKALHPSTTTFNLNLIRSPGNLFWCKGMRLAWDRAAEYYDYDFYLWLNDDVELFGGAITTLLDDYARQLQSADCVLIGACCESQEDNFITYSSNGPDGKNIVPNGKTPQRANDRFGGNFLFVPKSVAAKVGKISGFYHHCYGDFDYAKRLERAGIPFYVMSKVTGTCSAKNKPVKNLSDMPLTRRVKLLFEPGSFCLIDAIYYRLRFFGIMRAILSCGHICYIVLFAKGSRRGF